MLGLPTIQATNEIKVSCLMEQAFKGFNYSKDNKVTRKYGVEQ